MQMEMEALKKEVEALKKENEMLKIKAGCTTTNR